MGVVYRARDPRLGRQVALKVLSADTTRDEIAKQRFLHEARAASVLDHVNICTIHEIDETPDGQLYLVMAYYEGRTLAQRIDQGPIPLADALDYVMQIGRGLAEAHGSAIVHRDIKPANILITNSGVVKILDFGLAKLAGMGVATQTGMISGHRRLHVARAGAGTGARSPDRHLVGRGRPLRDAGGPPPVPGRQPVVALPGHRADAARGARRRAPGPASRGRTHRRAAAGEAARRPLSIPAGAAERPGGYTGIPSGSAARAPASSTRTRVAPSIAVLAFADMSPEKDQDYFCEGMAEELINALAAIEGMHVAARTSSFQFKGQRVDVSEIGRRLKVAIVLEGSVRKAGSRLRITAQLISAVDGYQLWSERYDRDMADVFAVQDEIARSVVSELRVKVLGRTDSTPLVKRHTGDLAAYHAFLRGRHCRFSLYDLRGAIGFFEQAVQQDPSYALAHAAIADCFCILGLYAVLAPHAAAAKARAAGLRARELDEQLAEAHGALGQIAFLFDWNWAEAERALARACELRPSNVETYCWYGYFLATMGRPDDGLAEIRRAGELDPLSAYVRSYAAVVLYIARRFDQAIAECESALAIQPGFGLALNSAALSSSAAGRHDAAIQYAEQLVASSARSSHSLGTLGALLAAAGRRDEARAVLSELSVRAQAGYVSPLPAAGVLAGLGDIDGAFAQLDKAFAERTPMLHSVRFPNHDSLRADPRWLDLVQRLNFPWPAVGPAPEPQ